MRWPLRRRHRAAAPTSPDLRSVTEAGRERHPELHPERSRPRADWARLELLRPASATPPLTFHGDRFGRSVAGARPLAALRRPLRGRSGPVGVVFGIVQTGAAVTPPTLPAAPGSVLPAPRVHRRPVSTAAVGAQRLTTSDFEADFAPVRAPLTGSAATATAWTLATGFGDDHPGDPVEHPNRPDVPPVLEQMRIRRRPVDDAARGGAAGAHTDPVAADDTDDDPSDLPVADDEAVPGPRTVTDAPVTARFLPTPGRRPSPWAESVTAPSDVVAAVTAATGIDVGDAPIDRSPAVTERARAIGAVAYTEQGTVHLPAEVGPLDDPVVRAVVAHELTHVAQQRAGTTSQPGEESAAGQVLEEQARTVQRTVYAGEVVTPTFLRRTEAPDVARAGVQRLAVSDRAADDWSEVDLSEVAPGSDADPFRWQGRTEEPAEADWDTRRDWAEAFEQDHAAQLQAIRDVRYDELAADVATDRPVDLPRLPLGTEQVRAVRRQLDRELPYQFGPPVGVEPYPARPDAWPAATVVRPERVPVLLPVVTPARLPELVHPAPTPAPVLAAPAVEPVPTEPTALDLTEQRLTRERELRHAVLADKQASARALGGIVTVALTDEEISQIRLVVDLELPSGTPFPSYLEATEDVTLSATGEYGPAQVDAATGPVDATEPATEPADATELATGPADATELGTGPIALGTIVAGQTVVAGATGHPVTVSGPPDLAALPVGADAEMTSGAVIASDPAETDQLGGRDPLAHPDIDGNPFADAELAGRVVDSLSEIDLEVLTRKLYRRIRTHLRIELLTDRERAGALADVR